MTTVEDLLLRHAYDPIKAREYYLRTRELKGREPGKQNPTSTRQSGGAQRTTIPGGKLKSPPTTLTPQQRKAAIERRVTVLKGRLEQLKMALADFRKQVKNRSGANPSEGASKDAKTDKGKQPQTAAVRRERMIKARKELRASIDRARQKAAANKPAPQRRAT